MNARQNKSASAGEVSAADPANAPTRIDETGIIAFTGDVEQDAELMSTLFGLARFPIVYPQDSTLETIRQQVS